MRSLRLTLLGLAALSLAACQSSPGKHQPGVRKGVHIAPPVTLPAPLACSPSTSETPKLALPHTEITRAAAATPGPVDIAQVHTVNRPLADVGVWQTRADGWSRLALQIGSDGARSIAVRLRDLKMPAQTQVWLCSPDGKLRQGPFHEARDKEIWTPEFGGSQVRLEIWVPSVERQAFSGFLADVYGGYR